jgi:hypothetical protein
VSRFPSSPWRPYEPRFIFPTFSGLESRMGFSIPEWYQPTDIKYLRSLVAGSLKKNLVETMKDLVPELASLVISGFSKNLRFKLHILSRNGEYRASYKLPTNYKPGASVDVELSELFRKLNLPDEDHLVVAVMSRGRMDGYRSSPASFSMTYIDQDNIAIYRTGAFARPLNEGRLKAHAGFTGINPKIIATKDMVSSLMLINHSSDPEYALTARPASVLIREDGQRLEAEFGEIPPLGAREMSVADIFGDGIFDFLRSYRYNLRGHYFEQSPPATLQR